MNPDDDGFDDLPFVKFLKAARYWTYVALAAVITAKAVWCLAYH